MPNIHTNTYHKPSNYNKHDGACVSVCGGVSDDALAVLDACHAVHGALDGVGDVHYVVYGISAVLPYSCH